MASEGGWAPSPGVTTRGSGVHTSVALGSVIWADTLKVPIRRAAKASKFFFIVQFFNKKERQYKPRFKWI
jgi:hypothetical protein